MSKEILRQIIENFDIEKFEHFFRLKNDNFCFPKEEFLIDRQNFPDFTDGLKLAEGKISDTDFVVYTFKVLKNLSHRSGKKLQYTLGKNILKTFQKDAGIFIFYDLEGNFRFSLIYTNYSGNRRDWSNFKRFTYFVSKELTNKTFLQQIGESDFSTFEKIKEAFSVEPVTKQFYTEIQNWFFWAMDKVEFPDDEDKDKEVRNAKNLIRLITRLIFIWFMKVKNLIPEKIFEREFADEVLNYNDKTGSTYYKAVLQNLFFATLNTKMKKDDSKSRIFIEEATKRGYINDGYLQQGYYRYSRFIKNKELFLKQFENIPFLNGGLFDCLDKRVGDREIRIDCFSDNPKNETRLKVPDELFFLNQEIEVDLTKYLSESSERQVKRKVKGILEILKSYNFTIDENTPVDEEVALDPELLGKVFENLLAAYNPETKTTARKATGSYYTPREIVEYMVNESLVEYFKLHLSNQFPSYRGDQGVCEFPSHRGEQGVLESNSNIVEKGVLKWYQLPFNPKLKQKAKELRKSGNLSEVLFWQQVKNKKFLGLDFDRQKIIGDYIVDFYCKDLGIVVEIDGESHNYKPEYDEKREGYLKSFGLKVYHILDRDIKNNLSGVMEYLKKEITSLYSQWHEVNCDGIVNTPIFPSKRGELKNTPISPLREGNNTPESPLLEGKIRKLLSYSDEIPEFSQEEKQKIVSLVNNIKILDPACGSGAFPMGILHKLVLLLHKVDPKNELWLSSILEKIPCEARNEVEESLKNKPIDYIRKLGLIEHCIYGVDIQEIAIQISKLRFFISLLVEQEPDDTKPNRDIKALPNLETKFVAANTLIKIEKLPDEIANDELKNTIDQLFKIRENYFYANSRTEKLKLQQQEEKLKQKLKSLVVKNCEILTEINKEKLNFEIKQLKNELEKIKQNPLSITDTYNKNLFGEKDTSQPQNFTEKQIQRIKEEIFLRETKLIGLNNKTFKDKILDTATKILDFNPYDQNKSTGWFDPEWMFGLKDGFDIVIANPPYIQLQNSIGIHSSQKYADLYKDQNYFTFDRTGDIYCLFYEKGIQLLKNNGILTYISSNKWMRSGYGEKLREFFTKHNPKVLIDLGPGIFESATVDTNIIIIEKTPISPKNFHLKAVTLERNQKDIDIKNQLDTKGVILTTLSKDTWFIGSNLEQKLKEKIEQIGKPLKDWDVKIYRGVLTGLNDAFIITTEKRNEILKNCKTKEERKRTEAIIKPILRGRDIKRYYYEWANLWVIGTFPALHLNINDYPALKKYFLDNFDIRQLEQSGKKYPKLGFNARKKTRNKWFETQDQIAYYQEFEKEKVVWTGVGKDLEVCVAQENFYINAPANFLTCKNYLLLTGILNSKLLNYYNNFIATKLGTFGTRFYLKDFEKLPIPPITPENEPIVKQIENLVDEIIQTKKQNKNADTTPLEQKIDKLVYKLYNLTDEEIKVVDN